jgi:ABC-type phosphate transport system substrate-binding protein
MGVRNLALAIVLAGVALHSVVPTVAHAQSDGLAIIVNRSNDSIDLTLDQVRKLFIGEKAKWRNGERVIVLMNASGAVERSVVLRRIFRMNEHEYKKYMMQAAFTGRVPTPPREVDAGEMKKIVADTPGAIGYLRLQDMDASVRAVLLIR